MSMTQEEIEALMNDTMGEAASEDNQSIDDLLAGIDGIIDDGDSKDEDLFDGSIDDLLAGIDGITDSHSASQDVEDIDIDDLLAGIDGITSSQPEEVKQEVVAPKATPKEQTKNDDDDSISKKIDKGIYPMPVEKEHKVVNQLNEVAEDSEEKASQIFDVLSYILDENDMTQRELSTITSFIEAQIQLLTTLNDKFPNVSVFAQNLESSLQAKTAIDAINNSLENENNKVFEAMELMQYHDINRQKIERVMAVIRKLSLYLSGLFEDDSNKPEVQIAKHISGDSSQTVSDDDLDSLIAEFSQDK